MREKIKYEPIVSIQSAKVFTTESSSNMSLNPIFIYFPHIKQHYKTLSWVGFR
jgi:hypothetical protein